MIGAAAWAMDTVVSWRERKGRIARLSEVETFAAGKPVVSFDFFDTLVVRTASSPSRLLRKSAEIAAAILWDSCGRTIDPEDYWRERIRTERQLAGEASGVWGTDEEASLPSIIRTLLDRMGVYTDDLCTMLVEAEFQLGNETLSLNEGAANLLQSLHASGKQLVVTSDTCLTEEHLRRMCTRLGIDGYISHYYSSGDVKYSKKSSHLFEYLLEVEGRGPHEVLHVGDKIPGDFRMPRSCGIDAVWIRSSRASLVVMETWQLDDRVATKAMREEVASLKADLRKTGATLEEAYVGGVLPAFFAMAYKVIRDSRKLGIRQLFFLARDAISIKPIYDILLARHPEFTGFALRTSVLHCSRASTVCCRFDESGDATTVIQTVLERFPALSYSNLFAAWNIDPAEMGEVSLIDQSEISGEALAARFASDLVFRERFEAAVHRQQELLYQYLVQEGAVGDTLALVDVGWGGTIQQNLQKLFRSRGHDVSVFGFYFGTDRRLGMSQLKGYLFSASDYRGESILRSASLTETLLSYRRHGSTTGYRQRDGRIEPVFRESDGPVAELEDARNRAIERYADVFMRLTRQRALLEGELIEHGKQCFWSMVTRPSRAFVRAMEKLDFQFDWGFQDSRPLVMGATIKDFFNPTRLMAKLWRNPWIFGSLKASGLGVFCRPLTWLLGLDPRVSRKFFDFVKGFMGRQQLPHRVI